MRKMLLLSSLLLLLVGQVFAQVTIKGHVTDKVGDPLPGANIMIKGTTQGTITDVNGYYELPNVPPNSILVFTFIGMEPTEVTVNNKTVIDVKLFEDAQSLEEVVVVGYGEVKRANLTGSVVNIRADEIEDIPVTNLSTALEGKLVGVKISQSTGKPGASTSFSIRTESSFSTATEDPLFVIDGVISDQDAFDLLDASEVKSISVLKDAAAAVYGAKAAGGVVLVETKHGKKGKAKFSYSGTYGIAQATNFPDMMNSYDLATMYNEILDIYANEGESPKKSWYYADDELEAFKDLNYNWLDDVWNNAYQMKHSLNVSGGSERVNYFISGNYYDEKGHLDNLYAKRYSLRTNMDAKITKGLTASMSLSFYQGKSKYPNYYYEESENLLRSTYKSTLTALPWVPPTIDGLPVNNQTGYNIYGLINSGSAKSSVANTMNFQASLAYEVPFIEGLKLKLSYSRNEKSSRTKDYTQNYLQYNFPTSGTYNHIVVDTLSYKSTQEKDNNEGLTETSSTSSSYQLNASMSYNRTFGKHNVGGLLVYEQSESENEEFWVRVEGNADVQGYEYLWAFANGTEDNGSSASESGSLGVIGRLTYNYAEKYIFEGTFRYEASEKFAPGKRWGLFPAISGGWVLSKENFFSDNISFISFMKLRGSAGKVGNDNISSFQWKLTYDADGTGAVFGDSETNALTANNSGIYIPSITWQKTNSYNMGLDMRFWGDRINLSAEYYYRFTFDILERRLSEIPTTLGISETQKMPVENHGQMYAKGLEFTLGYEGTYRALKYYVEGRFSWDKHREVKIFQNPSVVGSWKDDTKNDPSNQPGYICEGIVRTQEQLNEILEEHPNYRISTDDTYKELEVGMLYYRDIRGNDYIDDDGLLAYTEPNDTIDSNDNTIIAQMTDAPYNFSYSLGASWKGLKVDFTFTGSFGFKTFVNKDEHLDMDPEDGISNVFDFYKDYWTNDNTDAAYPRPYAYGLEDQHSSFWMKDGTNLRLKTVNLSYSLPQKYLQKLKIPELRVYFTARNLWTIISPFDFKDPSVSKAYDYPLMRTYNFGINFTL